MEKILVTGADGFIGSHLTEALVREGHQVKAFVAYNSFNHWGWLDHCGQDVAGEFEVVAGDIRDGAATRSAMHECRAVLHLASLIAIPFSYRAPESYIDTNIKGTLNVLQAARDLALEKVVHTSTSEVYGTAQFVPIDETHPLQGQSPYAATKIAADQLVQSFYLSFGTPVVTVRPFNTYGPRQSARAIIPTIITQALSGNNNLKLGSLHPTRDFSYVDDTVQGFLQALIAGNINGEVINLGSGFEISIGETVRIIAEILNTEIQVETDEGRLRPENSEVERLWADNKKGRKLLAWQPQYDGLEGFERGLRKTVDWFENPANLAGYKTGEYNV